MDLQVIKKCFLLFISLLDNNKIIDLPSEDELEGYDLISIKSSANFIYMQYLKINIIVDENSNIKRAFDHLNKMISELEGETLYLEIENLKSENVNMKKELEHYRDIFFYNKLSKH